ncbi:MAG: pyridoxamine 5'-phosphate oxidase family protein [Spirochaetaceae bacterium]|nr:pyridoxamine 5'-phosphate oxidase family protein [Spirochaetaceae bacterium]
MRRSDREITEKSEIVNILEKGDSCHIALCDGDTPYLVTMNYGFEWNDNLKIYLHCAREGKKIDLIKKNQKVCFSVDTGHELVVSEKACGWGMKYKSVVASGTIEIIENNADKIKGLNLLMKHYAGGTDFQYEEKMLQATTVLKITVSEVVGKEKK